MQKNFIILPYILNHKYSNKSWIFKMNSKFKIKNLIYISKIPKVIYIKGYMLQDSAISNDDAGIKALAKGHKNEKETHKSDKITKARR